MWQDKVIIERKNVKNINIRIRNGMVIVSAPLGVEKEYIYKLLKSREEWLNERLSIKRQEKIAELLKLEKIDSGHKVMFLGNEYEVKINEKVNGGIKINENILEINCYKKENAMGILKKFYLDELNRILKELVNKVEEKTNLKAKKITLKFMNTRWGSCNKVKGYINLNGELIAKRYSAIEYVILHEYCHLVHGNHSKAFYDLVEKYMKNYRDEEIYLNGK